VFDVLVIGGGHAGVEAAHAATQLNISVGLVTMPGVGIGSAPCNPSVGGVGKGQVVRELDALGGLMGKLTDLAGIQYRILNDSKGFAVQSTRVQIDKNAYSHFAEKELSTISNLKIIRDKVLNISKESNVFTVTTSSGDIKTKSVILTVGTFLNGKLHTGAQTTVGGRHTCESSASLDQIFSKIKIRQSRFKTGTPPRLKKNSINYSLLEEQPSDSSVRNFHCLNKPFNRNLAQVSCFLTRTNNKTMSVIRENKEKSPMYNGQIKGIGARYCPSIEDKAYRYPDKDVHHVFIEPEGLDLETMYPSGISSSLPAEVQESYVRTIEGLESAEIEVYGYAVEYDVIDTTCLNLTLEHREVEGLYFAGQVNGTSGYEEAAGQGLIAGFNAALKTTGQSPLILSRHDSYIGVMIEDLVSNTRDEPYRLFTARSENRLYLREDNTLLRMFSYRRSLSLMEELDIFQANFISQYETLSDFCDETMIAENSQLADILKGRAPTEIIPRRMSLTEVLKQAWINPIDALAKAMIHFGFELSTDLIKAVAIAKKYDGYIKRNEEQFNRLKKLDSMIIDWQAISESKNISFECKQRVARIKPETFGQLKLIEGIRPATLAVVASQSL
jgi:tRNA uridine 5-carboxymethylaminomethyl modification enzyme